MRTTSHLPPPAVFPHVLLVHASAGSGKTYSLALRFLQILALSGKPCDAALRRVLALTFTVAAAQEMKTRIVSFLKQIALQTPQGEVLQAQSGLDCEAARSWLDCIFEHFHSFQVKTIDSLHFQMVQALGRRLGLGPELEASFDQQRWAGLMLESLLARTDWSPHHLSEGRGGGMSLLPLWEDIFSVYLHLEVRSGVRFLDWLKDQARLVFSGLDQFIGQLGTTTLGSLKTRQGEYEARCREFLQELDRTGLQDMVSRFSPQDLLADPLVRIESAFFFKESPEQLFKKSALGRMESVSAWTSYTALCQARNALLMEKARLKVDPLARLQHLLIKETELLGRTQGLLLGGWWTRLIRQHLTSEGLFLEAGLVLDAGWRHVLMDEFQDTSREQWEVLRELTLEALAQGGSLFCVGDVKQAVYGWRGGDWRLFFEPLIPETFPNVEDHARQATALPLNRRSCPEIVEWINACFTPLADPGASAGLAEAMVGPGGSEYAKTALAGALATLYADSFQRAWRDCPGKVRTRDLQASNTLEYKQNALLCLVQEVQTMRESGRPLGSMAVLVRTNSEARECTKALLDRGIPTITEQSLAVAAHPCVRGLLALLAWLDDPEDDAALYALCRSPLMESLRPDLPRMISEIAGPRVGAKTARPPLEQLFRRDHPDIWAGTLRSFREEGAYFGAYDVLLAAVAHFRLREMPLGEWAWVEKLLEAAWTAELESTGSISAFLDFWRQKQSECVVGLPEGLEAVRVLTMHKAKGLEFPLVILPLLGYGMKNRPDYLVLDTDGQCFLAAAARPRSVEVAQAMDREMVKTLAEEMNLLYVALTRAREELLLFLADIETSKTVNASGWLMRLIPTS